MTPFYALLTSCVLSTAGMEPGKALQMLARLYMGILLFQNLHSCDHGNAPNRATCASPSSSETSTQSIKMPKLTTTINHYCWMCNGHICLPLCCMWSLSTVDRKIFMLKIVRVKNFRVVKFSRSHSICEIFLTVDDCNMDKRLESSWHLVYYQVSGEPGIAHCSRRSDI